VKRSVMNHTTRRKSDSSTPPVQLRHQLAMSARGVVEERLQIGAKCNAEVGCRYDVIVSEA